MNKERHFRKDPRDYAMVLVEDGMIDAIVLLSAALKWMSEDQVRSMLDANDLSPRFIDKEEDEE